MMTITANTTMPTTTPMKMGKLMHVASELVDALAWVSLIIVPERMKIEIIEAHLSWAYE
jgi:hypothetical protein